MASKRARCRICQTVMQLPRSLWRLKASDRRLLSIDLVALSAGLRPLVMVDYLPYSPNLPHQICTLLHELSKVCEETRLLRVMYMENFVYVFHMQALSDYIKRTFTADPSLMFVVLDDGPARLTTNEEQERLLRQLALIHDELDLLIGLSKAREGVLCEDKDNSEVVAPFDLSDIFAKMDIVVPSFNGWLLGYPVIYVFLRDNVRNAIQCLSTGRLHLYTVYVESSEFLSDIFSACGYIDGSTRRSDLLSFTIPFELSTLGCDEPWAKTFMSELANRSGLNCLKMEVSRRDFQSVAF